MIKSNIKNINRPHWSGLLDRVEKIEADPWMLIAEAGAIAVLAGAAYIMSLKDKLSLEKKALREQEKES